MNIKELINMTKDMPESTVILFESPDPALGTFVNEIEYRKDTNMLCFKTDDDSSESVTVGTLRDFAAKMSDDILDKIILTANVPYFDDTQSNIIRYMSVKKKCSGYIALVPKSSEDLKEELTSRAAYAVDTDLNDADYLQICFDDGFVVEDFLAVSEDSYWWAKKTKEDFACVELRERMCA